MPAESGKQARAAGIALSAKRGQTPVSKLRGSARSMHKSMTPAELAHFAGSPRTTKEVMGDHPAAGNPQSKRRSRKHKK